MRTEIESLEQLRELLATDHPLQGICLQDLDLTGPEGDRLRGRAVHGMVVLGGDLPAALEESLRARGAAIFPAEHGAPVNPYRAHLYTADELYEGLREHGYAATPDALAYEWSSHAHLERDAFATLLRAVHDHAMTDSLTELLLGRKVVGVMGGHALERGTAGYAAAAHLGRALASAGLTVLTGGGPGAMEAANLGASCRDAARLDEALARLARVPSFRPSIDDWARAAWEVRAQVTDDDSVLSIGVPTWFYGHEPPNLFAARIAKFFSNAQREDLLLAASESALVVLPGAAGTVQEVFQAVTPMYYASPGTAIRDLVLVGEEHWSRTVPVWGALQALAAGREMTQRVHLVATTDEATDIVLRDL